MKMFQANQFLQKRKNKNLAKRIEFRYALLPFIIIILVFENHKTELINETFIFEEPENQKFIIIYNMFIFGQRFLPPILNKGQNEQTVYFS